VLLDTSPISGGNACLFALLSGIPVVTMPGETVSSRLGSSVLLHYGFPEGLVDNLIDYEQRVLEFCQLRNMPTFRNQIDWKFTQTVERFLAA
jgi:predicted O-linked N-acetylglucosamine transferase (SPINDLY family)